MKKPGWTLRPGAKKNGSKSPTSASRKALAKSGDALPDGSFPVPTPDFARRALNSMGRVPPAKRAAVKSLIKKKVRQNAGKGGWGAISKHPALNMTRREEITIELATAAMGSNAAPVVSASDGPRTTLGPAGQAAFRKLKKQGKDDKQALAMARFVDKRAKAKAGK